MPQLESLLQPEGSPLGMPAAPPIPAAQQERRRWAVAAAALEGGCRGRAGARRHTHLRPSS